MRMERWRKTSRGWHSLKRGFAGSGSFNPDDVDGRLRTRSQGGRGGARGMEREEGEAGEKSER
jgi:hypothetical protein